MSRPCGAKSLKGSAVEFSRLAISVALYPTCEDRSATLRGGG